MYHGEELEEQVLTPSHLIISKSISLLSENVNISLDSHDFAGGGNWSRRFVYLPRKLNHFGPDGTNNTDSISPYPMTLLKDTLH